MSRTLMSIVTVPVVVLALSGPVAAQPPDHPRMRAALNELREARKDLNIAKDDRPAGYKKRALEAINDAVEALRINLAIRDVDTLKGLERNPQQLIFGGRPSIPEYNGRR